MTEKRITKPEAEQRGRDTDVDTFVKLKLVETALNVNNLRHLLIQTY